MTKEGLNIVLVGMMGAGKTFIGEKLSKLVSHFDYIDIDKEIEKEQNLKISDIFEKFSEKHFRKLEEKMIEKISKNKNTIISVGGGAFESPQNIENLKKSGIVFYLFAPPEELYNRLTKQKSEVSTRPMLSKDFSLEKLSKLLKKREQNYLLANFVIDTNGKPAYTILDNIIREYENYVK